MSPVRESLHNAIESLSDDEVRQILEFARHLLEKNATSPTLMRLAANPAFKIPQERSVAFHNIQPIHGQGEPASKLLIEDRR